MTRFDERRFDERVGCAALAEFIIEKRIADVAARPALAAQLAGVIAEAVEDWLFLLDMQLADIANMGGSDAPPPGTPEPE